MSVDGQLTPPTRSHPVQKEPSPQSSRPSAYPLPRSQLVQKESSPYRGDPSKAQGA